MKLRTGIARGVRFGLEAIRRARFGLAYMLVNISGLFLGLGNKIEPEWNKEEVAEWRSRIDKDMKEMG